MEPKLAPVPHTNPDVKCMGRGKDRVTSDRTIYGVRYVESLESEPSGMACRFFFALLCRGHLLSGTGRGQAA